MVNIAEYIWLDGTEPTQELRSKTRILDFKGEPKLENFVQWGFDGSSTGQADGNDSDCLLEPVCFVKDPLRGEGNYLVMCEVLNPDQSPHISNTRAKLRNILDNGGAEQEPWVGFEQEYTLFEGNKPLDWPDQGYPGPQGPYYCGVGAEKVFGRPLAEAHMKACIDAGLLIYGINAEVMPSQWEFQIGHRGFDDQVADPLTMSDHLMIGRWLLYRIAEDFGVEVSFAPKPVKGDWNGAGKHTNFSTKAMRDASTGAKTIEAAISRLEKKHSEHIEIYGDGLAERLTGDHETCHISEFRSGRSDRGASIRIPAHVAEKGYGYIEDRRPAANADPYLVTAKLISTICDINVTEKVTPIKKAVNG